MPERTKPQRRTVLAVSTALALALALGAEAWLRHRGWHERRPDFHFEAIQPQEARTGLLRSDPELVYGLAPGYRSSDGHAGAYATGPWPFRGRPATPAPAELTRVLLLGDSCVYGVGVDAADTLAAHLRRALARRGWSPTRLQVLNQGVPGYSTEQLARALERSLETLRPDAVVLYPAAWNDQAAALSAPDRELIERADTPLASLALVNWLAQWRPAPEARPAEEVEAIQRAWRDGNPPFGTRVPEADVRANVERMLTDCAAAGVPVVVVAPAQPLATLESHPRLRTDRESVAAAARAHGAPLRNAPDVLAAANLDDAAAFVDFVHTSPLANAALAEAVAAELAPLLGEPPAPARWAAIVTVSPTTAPSLGDVVVEVGLDRPFPSGETPVVLVGDAPLLEVERTGPNRARGTLMKNAPGPRDVLVQTSAGCAFAEGAIRLEAPRVERSGDRLRFRSRPGDRAVVVVASALWSTPARDPRGVARLDPDAVVASYAVTCDEDGIAPLPTEALQAGGPLFLQALVTPRAEADRTREQVYSELFRIP